jgi:hypothetical protein
MNWPDQDLTLQTLSSRAPFNLFTSYNGFWSENQRMITTCNQFYNPQLNQRCDSKHFFAAVETAVSQEGVALQI